MFNQKCTRLCLIFFVGFVFSMVRSEALEKIVCRNTPQGGGLLYPAWTGEYWDNPTLAGEPVYRKSEVRVRFDWEDWRPILGTRAESVRDFPTDHFSARWTGSLIARYEEEYTFKLLSDEGARFKIRPSGSKDWTVLIDAWEKHARRMDDGVISLSTGVTYEVQIDYYDLEGDAVCELYWESARTPLEVVDYISANSVKEYWCEMAANANGRGSSGRKTEGAGDLAFNAAKQGDYKTDENGWPTEDFSYVLQGGWSGYPGMHLVAFKGTAEISLSGTWHVDGKTYENTLPKGVGYNPETNETRAQIWINKRGYGSIRGRKTQRTPDSPVGSGVTDLYVMKPNGYNSDTPHELGEEASGMAREAFLPVFCIRIQTTGLNEVTSWDLRTKPSYSKIHGQFYKGDMAYERLIVMFNEFGRDMYLCFGGSIDYDFMDKLAKLTRYGSDGVNPYDKPTKNPVYPPLNPNLRLYIEHGNEMGWSAVQPFDWHKDLNKIEKEKREPEYSALNYDHTLDKAFGYTGKFRYHAYRTVRMSQYLHNAWGEDAMGDKVRVFLFGQYARYFQNQMLQYIDDYFNNGDGDNVENPHSVPYYLWGAGMAVYYGTSKLWVEGDTQWLTDRSFEDSELKPGGISLAPKKGAWTFDGTSGIVDVRYPKQPSHTVGTLDQPEKGEENRVLGFQITVGDQDLYLYEVGRAQMSGGRSVGIFNMQGKPVQNGASAVFSTRSITKRKKKKKGAASDPVSVDAIAWQPIRHYNWMAPGARRVGLIKLTANEQYIIVGDVPKKTAIAGPETRLEAGPGFTIDGAVQVDCESMRGRALKGKISKVSGPGTGYPGIFFSYTTQLHSPAEGVTIVPINPNLSKPIQSGGIGKSMIPKEVRTGNCMAFIAGKSSISQEFEIQEEGEYVLVITGSSGHDMTEVGYGEVKNPVTITVDDKVVWNMAAFGVGRKSEYSLFQYATYMFNLKPGTHRLKIAGMRDDPRAVVYIDGMHLGDLRDYYGPNAANFLDAGQATGQTTSKYSTNVKTCTMMAKNWGLVPVAYEGGYKAGGDWNGGNVFFATQSKWEHPLSKVADNNWAKFWHQYGGFNAMYYYVGFPASGMHESEKYMPWQAAIERAHKWQWITTEGLSISQPITCADPHSEGHPNSLHEGMGWFHPYSSSKPFRKKSDLQKGQWKSWIVLFPNTQEYTLSLAVRGEGKARFSLDEDTVIGTGITTIHGTQTITQGSHAIKVLCTEGSIDVGSITIRKKE